MKQVAWKIKINIISDKRCATLSVSSKAWLAEAPSSSPTWLPPRTYPSFKVTSMPYSQGYPGCPLCCTQWTSTAQQVGHPSLPLPPCRRSWRVRHWALLRTDLWLHLGCPEADKRLSSLHGGDKPECDYCYGLSHQKVQVFLGGGAAYHAAKTQQGKTTRYTG